MGFFRWHPAGLVTLALVAVACSGDRPALQQKPDCSTTFRLSVDGRASDSASVAALGRKVALVWRASADSQSDVYISVSTDGGERFGEPVRVNDVAGDVRGSGEQAPRVVISNAIHVVWPSRRDGHAVIRYATSQDDGRSFSPAVSIAGETLSGARGWPSIALMFDGAVHAVWLDGRHAMPRKGPHVHGQKSPGDPSPRQDIVHASLDVSAKPLENSIAADVCFCCKTAVVTTGETVLAAWRHIYPGSLRDIAFAVSKDRGRTFGAPIRVSEDGWRLDACPDDGPALAADAHGGVHIVWPTLVPGETPRKGIFYATLSGAAFTPRKRLDAGDADVAHPHIAADDHGNAAVVWDELVNGTRRVVLRRLSHVFEGPGVNYPVVAAADGHWIMAWTGQQADGRSVIEGLRIASK
jgi:hypothetical protein